jgi:hypothetical protein
VQYTVDEMPNKIEKSERETMGEPIYENCKDSIERLLYVIDAADEVAYYINGFEAYDFEMETFVSRGGSTVQSNGVEFGGAFLTSLPSILKTW